MFNSAASKTSILAMATVKRLAGILLTLPLIASLGLPWQPIALAFTSTPQTIAAAPAGERPPPLKNLNIILLRADDGQPLAQGYCVIGDDRRAADGSGFINFAVLESADARCGAPGHVARGITLRPGTRRVRLDADTRSVVAPRACGPSANPNDNRRECALQIAAGSANWTACSTRGDNPACHRFVREVARALAAGNPRWGLISKPRGQQSCSATACGADVGGYGQDVAAYRPDGAATSEWIGFDIVAGAGAPGATVIWNGPLPRRTDNLWVAVPR